MTLHDDQLWFDENYRKTAEVRRELFGGPPYPTATGVIVKGLLREGALIETQAIAVIPAPAAQEVMDVTDE